MNNKRKRNFLILLGVILAAVCVVLYIYIYTIPSVTGSLTQTATLTYGQLQTVDEAHCAVIRSEYTVSAESSGATSYYIEEGDKTRKGVKVADIYGSSSSTAYYLPETGFVSYYIDGYEEVFTPEYLNNIKIEDFYEADKEGNLTIPKEISSSDCRKGDVSRGDCMYKLINLDTWYIIVFIPEEESSQYQWNQSVTVILDGKEIKGTVSSLVDYGDIWTAVISTDLYHENFPKLRTLDCQIITHDNEGLIVPNTALTTVDGTIGVYVKNINSEYDFTPVEIVVSGESESLLTPDSFETKDENGETKTVSTVSIYDEVLRHAEDNEQSSDQE